jgi:Ger(x)C family germination protein
MLEIEDQAFIIGIGLDAVEGSDEMTVTFQIAQPKAFTAESQAEEPFWNIIEKAKDLTQARDHLLRSNSWVPTMEHCQVILIGEDLARKGLKDFLDFIVRTHEIRRRLKIGVVQGKARDILDMKFKSGLIPSFVLSDMMSQNTRYTYEITDYMTLGVIHTADVEGYDFILSRINEMEKELDMSGGAVFRDFKLVGWISGEEMIGARFLRGDVSAGFLTAALPPDLGEKVVLRIFEAKSSLKPEIRDGKLWAVMDFHVEGDIDEIVSTTEKLNDAEFILKCRELFTEYLVKNATKTFQKVQREYDSDPFRLKEKVKSYYPEFWKQNKGAWDEIYQSAELEVKGQVRIRRLGEIKR